MKKITQNTFNDGLNMDLNPIVTPNNVLTNCTNGTIITFNGDEFVLQNDMGNVALENCVLSKDFIPLGIKEYGGIIYIVSHNPLTGESEIGSFPSPEVIISPKTGIEDTSVNIDIMEFYENNEFFNEDISVRKNFGLTKNDIVKVGDKFIVYINAGDTNAIFQSLVSKYDSINNSNKNQSKKLFKLDLIRISESGNITTLTNNVKSDQNGNFYFEKPASPDVNPKLSDDAFYSLFHDNINGYLAILISVEKLSELLIDVYSTKSAIEGRFDIKLIVSDTTKDNHYNKLMGCKVEYTRNDNKTQTIDLGINGSELITVDGIDGQIPEPSKQHTINYSLNDFDVSDVVKLKITPYTAFGYLDKYIYEKELTSESTPEIGNIFRYRTDITNDDANLGNVNINLELPRFSDDSGILESDSAFIEFYDVWSDCSMMKEISVVSNQNITIPICKYEFLKESTNTRYGIPKSELVELINSDNIYSLLQKGTTKYKYINSSLRLNALYIVNIVVKKASYTDLISTHTLYTNGIFNNEYDLGVSKVFDTLKFDYKLSYTKEKENFSQQNIFLLDNFDSNPSYFWDLSEPKIKPIKLRDISKLDLDLDITNFSLFNLFDNKLSITSSNVESNINLSEGSSIASPSSTIIGDKLNVKILSPTQIDRETNTSPDKSTINNSNYESIPAYTGDFNSEFYPKVAFLSRDYFHEEGNNGKNVMLGLLKYSTQNNTIQPFAKYKAIKNDYRPFFLDDNYINNNQNDYRFIAVGDDFSININNILNRRDSDGLVPFNYRFVPYILGVANDVIDSRDGCTEAYVINPQGVRTIVSKSDEVYPDKAVIGILMKNSNGSYSALNVNFHESGMINRFPDYYSSSLNRLKSILQSSLNSCRKYNLISGVQDIYYSIINQDKMNALYKTIKVSMSTKVSMSFEMKAINGANNLSSSNISNYISSLINYETTNDYKFYNNLGNLTINNEVISSEYDLKFDINNTFKNIYDKKEQDALDKLSSSNLYDTTKVYVDGNIASDVIYRDNQILANDSSSYIALNKYKHPVDYTANICPIVLDRSNSFIYQNIDNSYIL